MGGADSVRPQRALSRAVTAKEEMGSVKRTKGPYGGEGGGGAVCFLSQTQGGCKISTGSSSKKEAQIEVRGKKKENGEKKEKTQTIR